MEKTLALADEMQQIANEYLNAPIYQFIGSGPNLATALLGAAKIKETSQNRAEAGNLEEFAHLHGLSMKEGDPIFIDSEPGLIGQVVAPTSIMFIGLSPPKLDTLALSPLLFCYSHHYLSPSRAAGAIARTEEAIYYLASALGC